MSIKPEAVEVTQQSMPVQQDPDYIRLRLDMQKLHTDIQNFLQGTTVVMFFDEQTKTYYERVQQTGSPLANKIGIQALLSLVVAVVNTHTVQGNTDKDELFNILTNMERAFAQRLTLNYTHWGIDKRNRDHIIDTIMLMVHLVLTRTIDNKERDSYKQDMTKVSTLLQDNKRKVL